MKPYQKYIYWILLVVFIFTSGLLSIENFQDDEELCDSNIGYCLNDSNFSNIKEDNIILTEDERKNLLDKLKKKPKTDWRDKSSCFSVPDGKETSIKTKEECKKNHGFWDKPCKNDFDCPYYARNKNTPTLKERGGCRAGKCEFPVNMKRIGYTKFLPEEEYIPYCDKCDLIPDYDGDKIGPCCSKQKEILSSIGLNSPNYFY